MSSLTSKRRFVIADLDWLTASPTTQPNAGLTAFRKSHGAADLFSVYLEFWKDDTRARAWDKAKIYALAEEMEARLPGPGDVLVVTAGSAAVAEARVISDGIDL